MPLPLRPACMVALDVPPWLRADQIPRELLASALHGYLTVGDRTHWRGCLLLHSLQNKGNQDTFVSSSLPSILLHLNLTDTGLRSGSKSCVGCISSVLWYHLVPKDTHWSANRPLPV